MILLIGSDTLCRPTVLLLEELESSLWAFRPPFYGSNGRSRNSRVLLCAESLKDAAGVPRRCSKISKRQSEDRKPAGSTCSCESLKGNQCAHQRHRDRKGRSGSTSRHHEHSRNPIERTAPQPTRSRSGGVRDTRGMTLVTEIHKPANLTWRPSL